MLPLKIFVSYSHQDEIYLNELEKHLTALKREKLIFTWHDRKIVPGHEWEKKIENALQDSDIFLFLISPDFVASEYCVEKEVAAAIKMHNDGAAVVIPIVVRPADWLSTPLGRIQALPKDAAPISASKNSDQAWLDVVSGIRRVVSELGERLAKASIGSNYSDINAVLMSVVEGIEERYGFMDVPGKHRFGVSTGLVDLDQVIDGLHPGDLVCVAASPVMDRMALLVSLMNSAFVENSMPGLVFTLRQTKEQVARRLCAAIGRISVHTIQRGELEDEDWSSMTRALAVLNDAKIGFVEQASISVDALISQIDRFKELNADCKLVVIDQFEQVTGDSKANLLARIGRYARANKLVIVLATGLEFDPALRPNKRPVLKDIGEWASLNEDLDVVVFVYQDEQYNPDTQDKGLAELIVAKNPRGPLATISVVHLRKGQAFVNHWKQLPPH